MYVTRPIQHFFTLTHQKTTTKNTTCNAIFTENTLFTVHYILPIQLAFGPLSPNMELIHKLQLLVLRQVLAQVSKGIHINFGILLVCHMIGLKKNLHNFVIQSEVN